MAWLIVAFLTTLGGLAAVNSLGDGILGSAERPLTHESVAAELSGPPSGPPPGTPSESPAFSPSAGPSRTPTGTGSPLEPPPAAPVSRTFSSAGGTVTAACSGDTVTLQYWSPAQGYEADHVVRGPAATVSLRFRQGGRGHGIRLAFTCQDGSPVQSSNTSDDG
jgi:hypothetical protein